MTPLTEDDERRLTTEEIQPQARTGLAPDVIALIIAAREVLDAGHMGEEFEQLDRAVEAFSERVAYENDPNQEEAAPQSAD